MINDVIRDMSQLRVKCAALEAERDEARDRAVQLFTELQAVKAERDALLRDAERYRWLRQRAAAQDVLLRRALYEDELDRAIDALREGEDEQ
jgi:hypothetical protein